MTGSAKTVGIIGGSGFIGGILAARLRKHAHLRVIDIAPPQSPADVPFVDANICDIARLVPALDGCDEIIHLAAVHRDDVRPPSRYFDVNVRGTENICEAARRLGIAKMIFTSSVAIYGLQAGIPDETTPPQPLNAYGRSKWQAEEALRFWHKQDPNSRELVIVRPAVVFGPGNRGNVYNLIAQLAGGRFVMVGSGTNRKSMAYVENIAEFLTQLALRPPIPGSRLYNYCDKPDLNMNELLDVVHRALGRSPAFRMRFPVVAGMAIAALFDAASALTGRNFAISRVRVRKFCANTIFASDLMGETGFRSPFALQEALTETVAAEFAAHR